MIYRLIQPLLMVLIAIIGPIELSAAKILITETHTDSGAQLMDLNWRRVSNILGHTPEIIDHTYLDSLHVLNSADVLIISSAVKAISNSQQHNIHQFVLQGGHVYVQSEFKMDFAGNQLFDFLVNKSGGSFSWEGESSFNVNPISVPSYLSAGDGPTSLSYFWNGTYGCGGEQVFPIFEHDNKHYGFLFIPNKTGRGRVMTVSDQDWIKVATEVGQSHRLQMMQKLLTALNDGVDQLVTPDIQISYLQHSVCLDSGFDVIAKVGETVLDYALDWTKNGVGQKHLSDKKNFEMYDLVEGDLLEAKITILDACRPVEVISNIIEVERLFPLSMAGLQIAGNPQVCLGESASYVGKATDLVDGTDMTYVWKINGTDQEIDNDTLVIESPVSSDIITLSVLFDDGCTMIETEAENQVEVEVIGRPIPQLSISSDKDHYCMQETATINLEGLEDDITYEIKWMIDGNPIDSDKSVYSLPSLTNNHEVYASVTYTDPCAGQVNLSSAITDIKVMNPSIKITEKQNSSCGLDIGKITLNTSGGLEPYNYQWASQSVENVIDHLPTGVHMITVLDAAGCKDEISTSIVDVLPAIVDSLVIAQQACDNDQPALVQLYTNPSFSNSLSLLWSNDKGEAMNVDFSEAELKPGNYEIIASVNDECTEVRRFEVVSNQIDKSKTNFTIESGQPILLDLELNEMDIANIVWNGGTGIDCTDCTWPTFIGLEDQSFQVDLITKSGCTFQFDISVEVTKSEKLPYFAPSAFSPNGDSNNDLFEFFVDDSIESLNELLVFDRWGNLVYRAHSVETVKWDGKSKGQMVQAGVYLYVAKMTAKDGREVVGNGTLVLTR